MRRSPNTRLFDVALLALGGGCLSSVAFWVLGTGWQHELSAFVLALAAFVLLLKYRFETIKSGQSGVFGHEVIRVKGVGYLHFSPSTEHWVANPVAQALLRLPSAKFNAPLSMMIQRVHPQDRDKVKEVFENALSIASPVSGLMRLGGDSEGETHVRYYAELIEDQTLAVSLVDVEVEYEARTHAAFTARRLKETLRTARASSLEADLNSGIVKAPELSRELLGLDVGGDVEALINRISEEYRDDFRSRLEHGEAFEHAYPVESAADSVKWVRFSASPGSGHAVHLTLVDLTEQHDSEAAQRSVLEQIKVASKFAKLSIYRESIETRTLEPIYVHPEQAFEFCTSEELKLRVPNSSHADLARAQTEPGTIVEIPFVTDEGKQVWLRYAINAEFSKGDSDRRSVLIQDISSLVEKRMEAQRSLESVNLVEQELRKRTERERQMFAVIGHELRTPAASIKMLLEHMELDDSSIEVQTLSEQVEHLLDVLDDVRILVSPERAYQSEAREVVLLPLFARAIESLKPLALESKIRISLAADEGAEKAYKTNPQLLRQLALNLIRNACFHSRASSLNVTVRTREIDELSTRVILRFEDNGRGVPKDFQEKLFQPFHREDNQSQGMGLGLSICQTLIEKLQGKIWYEDAPGGGAAFIVEFELTPAATNLDALGFPRAKRDKPVSVDWSQLRVLLAEDNATIRMLTEKMLTTKGAKVFSGADGKLAADRFVGKDINLVLTDIFMPNMDGYELTEELRKAGFRGPIIGISAAVVGDETDRLIEAGADVVMSKPIKMQELEGHLLEMAGRFDFNKDPANASRAS